MLFGYSFTACKKTGERKILLHVIESNVSNSKYIEPFHPILNLLLRLSGMKSHSSFLFPSISDMPNLVLATLSHFCAFLHLFPDAPSCRAGQKTAYGSSIGETMAISCDVDSNPSSNLMFHWIFRSFHSNESITVSSPSSFLTNDPLHQQQQLILQQSQHGYRMKGKQINHENGKSQRKESIFHNNSNSNGRKGVLSSFSSLPRADKKPASSSSASSSISSPSSGSGLYEEAPSSSFDPVINSGRSRDQSSFIIEGHESDSNGSNKNNNNSDSTSHETRNRRKREKDGDDEKSSEENSLTLPIINKKKTEPFPSSPPHPSRSPHSPQAFSRQQQQKIVEIGFKGVSDGTTRKLDGEEGEIRRRRRRRRESDGEKVTMLTCDDGDEVVENLSTFEATDKSRGSINSQDEKKWKRMKRKRENYQVKGCKGMKVRGDEETRFGNHISFNSTTLDPINRKFDDKRRRRKRRERRRDVSDMNNLPVIRQNQEEEEKAAEEDEGGEHRRQEQESMLLPSTQSEVPSSPLSLAISADKENRHVDPLSSSRRETRLNHITEPDEELFFHDMASSPSLGGANREPVNSKLKYSSEGTRSWLYFTPTSKYDFGSFECWATNSIGKQSFPCLFTINAAGNFEL